MNLVVKCVCESRRDNDDSRRDNSSRDVILQDRMHTLESTFPVPDHHHKNSSNHPQWECNHPQFEGHKQKNQRS